MVNAEAKYKNRQANDWAWFTQEVVIRLQDGKTVSPKLIAWAKEALVGLRDLTGADYREVIEDLDRLIGGHAPRGAAWSQTIDQMENVLQWTQNAPMSPRQEVVA